MRFLRWSALLLLVSCHNRDPVEAPDGVGISGVRRLSAAEYDSVLEDLLLDESRPAAATLPPDVIDPFDNDFTLQEPTGVLVTGLESLANDAATRFVADPARRSAVVDCPDPSPTNTGCLSAFATDFGRRALRRPLTPDEVAAFTQLGAAFASDEGDFWEGIDVMVRAFLQHPELTYRVERGSPTGSPGVYRLNDYEIATRLSFFLWGTTPDDALLDYAASGLLSDPRTLALVAEQMIQDPRALERTDRFHALWLGYWALPHAPDLTSAMRLETRRLIDEVIYREPRSWLELFTMDGTWIDDDLAAHYQLAPPGSSEPAWVPYAGTTRKGILSHGAFLSVAGKFGDTSPTQRGKLVRNRLMCQTIPPPPASVNVDEPPDDPNSDCKYDNYSAHRASGSSCKSCHDALDPVGFGLENYDQAGVYREFDNGHPECPIDGTGDVDGAGFTGPAGLADLLVQGDGLTDCMVEQLYRFAMGHAPVEADAPLLQALTDSFPASGHRFDTLMLDLVTDPAFQFRREETP